MENKEKLAALARAVCDEVSMALCESEGQRYFVTGATYTDWESFQKQLGDELKFAEMTDKFSDIDLALASAEARASVVATMKNGLSDAIGPKGCFVVAKQPPLVHDENCPEDQVQDAICLIRGGYPHVRCVAVTDKHSTGVVFVTLDMAYYRLS